MSIWGDIQRRGMGVNLKKEDIIFEEMVYSRDRKTELIAHNIYNGVEYFVVNYGHHPAGYIACDKSFLDKYTDDWGNIDVIDVHGGVTFTGDLYGLKAINKKGKLYGFGWDYAHACDWAGYMPDSINEGSRKYDTWMVVEECKHAIDQYLEIQKKDTWMVVEECKHAIDQYLEIQKKDKIDSTSFTFVADEWFAARRKERENKIQIHTMK